MSILQFSKHFQLIFDKISNVNKRRTQNGGSGGSLIKKCCKDPIILSNYFQLPTPKRYFHPKFHLISNDLFRFLQRVEHCWSRRSLVVVYWLIRRKVRVQISGQISKRKYEQNYFFDNFFPADFWQKKTLESK